MQSPAREPSMEDILASIKKVIAEEKDLRSAAPIARRPEADPDAEESLAAESLATESLATEPLAEEHGDEVLELDQPVDQLLAPPADLGPPLIDQGVAATSRQSLETLTSVAATAPALPPVNPLEDMIRELLRPILKQWLDDHLPGIVDEHVKREITRITGRPL